MTLQANGTQNGDRGDNRSQKYDNVAVTGITDVGLQHLADAKIPLQTLDLSGCEITDVGLQHLADAKTPLQTLDLSGCEITDVGLQHLADAKTPLQTLDLSGCEITDVGLQHLAKAEIPLHTLNLSWCPITDVGLQHFADAETPLQTLDLSGCKITDVGLQHLAKAKIPLQTLHLIGRKITDVGLQHLADADTPLQTLSLSECDITDVGLKHLAKAKIPLQTLDLSGCDITDIGLQHLADAETPLQTLNLSECEITDVGLQYLAAAKTPLQTLDLSECDITDVGLQYLADAETLLQTLHISGFKITDVGLQYLADAEIPLQTLDLAFCEITDAGLKHLADAKIPLQRLDLYVCKQITDVGLQHLADANTPLQTLHISGCKQITDVGLQHLAKAKIPLQTLHLSRCEITDVGLQHLADAETPLQTLNLSGCEITDIGLQYLAAAKTPLQTLDLSGCDITDVGLQHLVDAKIPLQTLKLKGCSKITEIGLKYLEALLPSNGGSLRVIDIDFCHGLGLAVEILRQEKAVEVFRLLAAATDILQEVKLLLLGDGRIGKTQLFKQFLGLQLDGNEPSTPDFAIGRRSIDTMFGKSSTKHQLQVNCFDFAGQQSMHASHRFFLTSKRTAFVVVVDATKTKEENHLFYWLGFVRHYCKSQSEGANFHESESLQKSFPPVLVVVSHCDEVKTKNRKFTIDANELKKLYPGPIELLDAFHCDPSSSDDVRKSMKEDLEQSLRPLLAHLSEAFDKRTMRGIRKLRQWVTGDTTAVPRFTFEKYGSVSDFNEVCKVVGQKDQTEFKTSLKTLRDLGAVHWVGDSDDVAKYESVAHYVFSPEWVKTPVGYVVRFSNLGSTHGMIRQSALVRNMKEDTANISMEIASGDNFEFEVLLVIRLMEACNLVVREYSAGQTNDPLLLVLDQMPYTNEDLNDGGKGELFQIGKANGFVPESMLARLAAAFFKHIPSSTSDLYRNQITLRDETVSRDCRATLRCDHLAGTFEVRMRGGTGKDQESLWLVILHEMKKLRDATEVSWSKVQPKAGSSTVKKEKLSPSRIQAWSVCHEYLCIRKKPMPKTIKELHDLLRKDPEHRENTHQNPLTFTKYLREAKKVLGDPALNDEDGSRSFGRFRDFDRSDRTKADS